MFSFLQQCFADDKTKLWVCIRINLFVILIGVLICLIHGDFSRVNIGPRDDLYIIGVQVNNYYLYTVFAIYTMMMQIALLFTEEFALAVIEFTVYNPQCDAIEGFEKIEMIFLTIIVFVTKGALKVLKIYMVTESLDSILLLFFAEESITVITVRLLVEPKKFIPKTTDLFKSEANTISQLFKTIFFL
jgi:hypothetical protein